MCVSVEKQKFFFPDMELGFINDILVEDINGKETQNFISLIFYLDSSQNSKNLK